MPDFKRINDALNSQYKDSSNLEARIALHTRFSTSTYGWYRWIMDHYDLLPDARILEVGCGSARFWQNVADRIPAGWDITLTDMQTGMLDDARANLQNIQHPFKFQVVNAQDIPFEDASFDAVAAHHMLYHVPDRPKALAEIHRVLKPAGVLFAATNGPNHNRGMTDILIETFPEFTEVIQSRLGVTHNTFRLDSGLPELQAVFGSVQVKRYEDSYHITEAEPLVAYLLSTHPDAGVTEEQINRLRQNIQRRIDADGAIDIPKDPGMFICRK